MKHAYLCALLVACGGSSTPPTLPVTPPPAGAEQPVQPAPAAPATEAAAAITAPAPKGNPRSDLISRQTLFGNPDRADVRISPDGKTVSWLAAKDGVLNVWIAPIDKLDQARAVTSDTKRPIQRYWWAFTNKHIIYAQDAAGDENFHLFRVDLADGKTTDLTPYPGARADLAGITEKKPTTLLATINDRDPKVMDVYRIDLLKGTRELVVQNDHDAVDFTPDWNLDVRLASKSQADGTSQIFMLTTKAGKTVWQEWQTVPFEDATTTSVLAFAPDGKSVYMTDSRGRDTAALTQVDLATKKSKVLASDARADSGPVVLHPTKHNAQAVGFQYTKLGWQVLDKSIQRDVAALTKIDPGELALGSRTLDDKTWIVSFDSDQHSRHFYRWDRAKQKATFLFAVRPELDKQPLAKMWPVEIKARDGLTLVSYLTLPIGADANNDGKADKPVPMVLFVHGGPWGRDSWGFDPFHQLLANRGYAVLSVNFRSSTGFGKKFINAGNLQWGKAMHTDLLDAVGWAIDQHVTDKDTVCIMGGSYGGYATLAALTMTPDVFRCGVDIVGPSNLMTLLSTIPPYWAPMVSMFHTRMGNPATPEGKALLTEVSPLTHAAAIKKPLLIAQGKNDPRVKEAESQQIVDAMKKNHLPVTYVVFPDEGHGFHRPENMIAFDAVTEAFLSAYLGGSYLPITKDEVGASTMQFVEGKNLIPGLPQ